MSIFAKAKTISAIDRLLEEQMFEAAVSEFKSGEIREGLMAKALTETEGDTKKAEALYLKLRVQSLKDEANVQHSFIQEVEKEAARNEQAKEPIQKIERSSSKSSSFPIFLILFMVFIGLSFYGLLQLD